MARLGALETIFQGSTPKRDDGRLWAIALGLSLLFNAGVLTALGFASIQSRQLRRNVPQTAPIPTETVVTIYPEMMPSPAATATAVVEPAAEPPSSLPAPTGSVKPRFARTSEDQTSGPPEPTPFIGERNTLATSDRAPTAGAPPLPSQTGVPPRDNDDLETTQSRYQDGSLTGGQPPKPTPDPVPEETPPEPPTPATPATDPAMATNPIAGDKTGTTGEEASPAKISPQDAVLPGTDPVDVPVPRKTEPDRGIKPTPPRPRVEGAAGESSLPPPKPPAAQPIDDPAFRGNQQKTAIVGSISRTGRSSLNVADTPLGRYQAIVSRAVELEWQRNCTRHRDFITPGFLTVRFFVEPSGKVRTVQFVGKMQTGEIQKGFTLNSIRDAEIPPMPAALKKDYTKDPLELIFNFYF